MEVFILTVLKIVAVMLVLALTRAGVQLVCEGQMKNHWGGWAMSLACTFLGVGFISEITEVNPSAFLPQMCAVMLVQSVAYWWWAVTTPKPEQSDASR